MAGKHSTALRFTTSHHPVVYEVNTRVLLTELSRQEGRLVTLATFPESLLDNWKDLGFDAIWLMGIWNTGTIGMSIARSHEGLQQEYRHALPDLVPEDITGSPYAIQAYTPLPSVGGFEGLRSFRKRLAKRNIALVLDFVANHTARDHAWITTHPGYYIQGSPGDDQREPEKYFRTMTQDGERVLAYGRDPYFPGWTDTAQMNIADAGARSALVGELRRMALECDGVRCDMAMLLLRNIFARTWEGRLPTDSAVMGGEFWDEAIRAIRQQHPKFVFMAESYWNCEWELQKLGFDFTYDKVLYDRLLREGAYSVREHLKADTAFQSRSVRFIENHDEPRAASVFPGIPAHLAAATIAATVPGMFLLHEGQMEGRAVRVPVQLRRRPQEPESPEIKEFYRRLLTSINTRIIRRGEWSLLDIRPAWEGNFTWQNFVASWWTMGGSQARLMVANYAPHTGQCYVAIPEPEEPILEFSDLLGEAVFSRDRQGLAAKGMYFELPAYGIHLFDVFPTA